MILLHTRFCLLYKIIYIFRKTISVSSTHSTHLTHTIKTILEEFSINVSYVSYVWRIWSCNYYSTTCFHNEFMYVHIPVLDRLILPINLQGLYSISYNLIYYAYKFLNKWDLFETSEIIWSRLTKECKPTKTVWMI